jgi:hypothetical protein
MISEVAIGVISAWTIVASVVFTDQTVQALAFGASLAISGLGIGGLAAHEVTLEDAVESTAGASAGARGETRGGRVTKGRRLRQRGGSSAVPLPQRRDSRVNVRISRGLSCW